KLGWIGVKNVCIFIFSPYPGSILFDRVFDVKAITKEEYDNYLLYQVYNTPGARVFNPKDIWRFPKEQFYTLLGNIFSVLAYIVFVIRRPIYLFKSIKNVRSGNPQGAIEIGLYSLLKKGSK